MTHLWVSDNILDTLLHISGAGAHGSLWSTNNTSMVPTKDMSQVSVPPLP